MTASAATSGDERGSKLSIATDVQKLPILVRYVPIATNTPLRNFIRWAVTAPTFMALTCRWRSRPQHQQQTLRQT